MTKQSYNYILTIDVTQDYDTNILKEKLDIAVDWLRIVPGCYFIQSTTSDIDKLYIRFKKALPNNRFFIAKLDINNGEYTGWLSKGKWDWIKNKK